MDPQIEIASLDLRYESCRMKSPGAERQLRASIANGVSQTLIIDLIRLYFCLISDCLDISDLTMFALRLTAEYVRPNNSPICLFVYKPVPLKK